MIEKLVFAFIAGRDQRIRVQIAATPPVIFMKIVKIKPPKSCNIIVGFNDSIPLIELHQKIESFLPGIRFGVALKNDSGIASSGNDEALETLAKENIPGNGFLVISKNYPLKALRSLDGISEICASDKHIEAVVESEKIIGVIDKH